MGSPFCSVWAKAKAVRYANFCVIDPVLFLATRSSFQASSPLCYQVSPTEVLTWPQQRDPQSPMYFLFGNFSRGRWLFSWDSEMQRDQDMAVPGHTKKLFSQCKWHFQHQDIFPASTQFHGHFCLWSQRWLSVWRDSLTFPTAVATATLAGLPSHLYQSETWKFILLTGSIMKTSYYLWIQLMGALKKNLFPKHGLDRWFFSLCERLGFSTKAACPVGRRWGNIS